MGRRTALAVVAGAEVCAMAVWCPEIAEAHGWESALLILGAGPALGAVAMIRLQGLPEAAALAG